MASSSNITKFLQLSQYDNKTKRSRLVCCDEFISEYQSIENKNGGGWCRLDGTFGKKFKVVTMKKNGDIKYSWDPENQEIDEIQTILPTNTNEKGNAIKYMFIFGEQNLSAGRPIGKNIRDALGNSPCVACGTTSNIEIDHKNGLYNNPRVLCLSTQTVDDFQPLCKHCNDQKRQTYKKMKETGVRYGATSIPIFKMLGVDYIKGDSSYDINDPDTMIGTYWYDPVAFVTSFQRT
jgi:hypothetical protein